MKEVNSVELVDSLDFCVIDLETTGGNPKVDQIIEIGLVKIKSRKIVETKNYLINPEMDIPEFIQKLTSIKQADIVDCPPIEDVIDEIMDFIGDTILVAHNTSFDVPFLNGILKKLNKPQLENKVLCTNVMTKYLIPEIMNSNLNYMSQLFKIDHFKAHRAIEDAKATAHLLLKYLDIFIEKKIRKVNQLYYPRNKFELDRIHINKGTDINEVLKIVDNLKSPVVLSFKGEQGVLLATLPLESPGEDKKFIKELCEKIDWQILTLKLVGPFFEGLLQLNSHFLKIPQTNQDLILGYLTSKYKLDANADAKVLNEFDFVIAPHLVTNQLTVYSFLNLNTKNQLIFKFPGHKKKFLQYMKNQIARFEKNAKGRRKNNIIKPLVPLFVHYLNNMKENDKYLISKSKAYKERPQDELNRIEKFLLSFPNLYDFPATHL
jgi:DNA polymerase-3 subunit epsilon